MPRGDHMRTEKPIIIAELPPAERGQHDDVILESIWIKQTSMRSRAKVRNPLQLDKLHSKRTKGGERILPFNAFIAGMRVAWLYSEAGMQQRTITRYDDAKLRGDYQNRVARAGDAYHHWHLALRLVTPWASNEVFEVCCMDHKPGGSIRMEILRRGLLFLYDRRHDWWGGSVDDSDLVMDGA